MNQLQNVKSFVLLKYKIVSFDDIANYNLHVCSERLLVFYEYYPDRIFEKTRTHYLDKCDWAAVRTEQQYQFFKKILISELCEYENGQQ